MEPQGVGLGVIVTSNYNGDSTDTYFNIFRGDNDSSRFFLRTEMEDPYFLYLGVQAKAIDASDTSFKDPDEFCCLFVIDGEFTRFVYIPYPID